MTTKGLGKGLGALMSMFDDDLDEITGKASDSPKIAAAKTSTAVAAVSVGSGAQEIEVALIDNNTAQPRKAFNAEEMQELEQSIMTHGILQPILVNKVGTRYMIVAGERRWRAARNIGLRTIPALVRNYTSKQVAEIALVENLMRSDLNEIEIALGVKKLMDTYLMTQEQVSAVLGKSRSAVANSLRLLNLPQEIQTMLEQKKITMGHAKCLVAVTDKNHMLSLARKCAEGLMTVRELENATSGKQWDKVLAPPKKQSLELKEFIINMTQILATKVSIQGDDRRGKIIIEYNSLKDLERIKSKIK